MIRVGFSREPPANLPALHIYLTEDAAPFKGKLRNYLLEQQQVLSATVKMLESHDLAYRNPAGKLAYVPLSVGKPEINTCCFTVYL